MIIGMVTMLVLVITIGIEVVRSEDDVVHFEFEFSTDDLARDTPIINHQESDGVMMDVQITNDINWRGSDTFPQVEQDLSLRDMRDPQTTIRDLEELFDRGNKLEDEFNATWSNCTRPVDYGRFTGISFS
jgi:hypothetical protein